MKTLTTKSKAQQLTGQKTKQEENRLVFLLLGL